MTPKRKIAAVTLALLACTVSRTFAQDAPPPSPPPSPTPPAVEEAPATPPPALSEAAVAALQQAKDAFKKGSWQEAREAAATVLDLKGRPIAVV